MAFPTAVNSQITDSVTQSNVEVLASAPAQAMGSLYQAMANSSGLAANNAVSNQQNSNTISSAVVTQCVAKLLGSASA
jgi:hypothetical protein